jgi:type VI secretion system protein VasD
MRNPIRRLTLKGYLLVSVPKMAQVVVWMTALILAACGGAVQTASGKAAEIALSAIGVKAPESVNGKSRPTIVPVRITAATDMNADESGQGLSMVVRLYHLKSNNSFLMAPYSAFGHPDKEKQAIGDDLIEAREMVVSPGQTIESKERLTDDAAYLGLAALFRTPSAQRWRFAFAASDAQRSGVVIGLHACAMTAIGTAPTGKRAGETASLSPARCN